MISSPFNVHHQYSPSMNNANGNGTSSFKHANNYGNDHANNYRNGNGTAMTVIPNGVNGYGPNLNNGGGGANNGGAGVDYSAYRHMTLRSDAAAYEGGGGVGYIHGGGNGAVHHNNGGY